MKRKTIPVFCSCEKYILLCRCGCGRYVTPGSRFIRGHQSVGKIASEETRQKQRDRVVSEESKQKNRLAHTGKVQSEETKKKRSLATKGRSNYWLAGKTQSKEANQRRSEKMKGRTFSSVHRVNLKKARVKRVYPLQDSKTVEIPLQEFFDRHGILFEKHWVLTELHPYHQFDVVIPYLKLIIEGQGCYWHGCQDCFPGSVSKSAFDKELPLVLRRATLLGWNIIEVWEHDIRSGAAWQVLLDWVVQLENDLVKR